MKNQHTLGHLSALMTILIWGTTFISTKILLNAFLPIEILFFRFSIGFIVLLLIYPHRLKGASKGQELTFALAGLCGVTLYYLLENIALTFTTASNVGVISSIIPFFTAIFTYFFLKEEPMRLPFFIGFIIATIGIFLISFNGVAHLQLNPLGDLLAVTATIAWAAYSILTRKISEYGYHTIQVTRRIFFYGIVWMSPVLYFGHFQLKIERFADPVLLFNLLFLGLGASALCFLTWNYAVKVLGAVKSSIYIYGVPVVTVFTSILILHERLTYLSAMGIVLTLVGLYISEKKTMNGKRKRQRMSIQQNG